MNTFYFIALPGGVPKAHKLFNHCISLNSDCSKAVNFLDFDFIRRSASKISEACDRRFGDLCLGDFFGDIFLHTPFTRLEPLGQRLILYNTKGKIFIHATRTSAPSSISYPIIPIIHFLKH